MYGGQGYGAYYGAFQPAQQQQQQNGTFAGGGVPGNAINPISVNAAQGAAYGSGYGHAAGQHAVFGQGGAYGGGQYGAYMQQQQPQYNLGYGQPQQPQHQQVQTAYAWPQQSQQQQHFQQQQQQQQMPQHGGYPPQQYQLLGQQPPAAVHVSAPEARSGTEAPPPLPPLPPAPPDEGPPPLPPEPNPGPGPPGQPAPGHMGSANPSAYMQQPGYGAQGYAAVQQQAWPYQEQQQQVQQQAYYHAAYHNTGMAAAPSGMTMGYAQHGHAAAPYQAQYAGHMQQQAQVRPAAAQQQHHVMAVTQQAQHAQHVATQQAPAQPPLAAPAAAAAPVAAVAAEVVDIARLLQPPHRDARPKKILLILRGLPGSGKSTAAKRVRDAEVAEGGEAPRIHSLDDYYMQEVEVEVVEEEGGRKKRRKVTEVKYVYEQDLEASYTRDLVRAVGRSCEDRRHTFVVVDAPNPRVEQLKELVAVAQRTNFEPYVAQPLEADPAACAARNVHGRTLAEVQAAAAAFEACPALYTQVSLASLFKPAAITEVNMDEQDDQAADEQLDDDEDAADTRPGKDTSRWHDAANAGRGGSGSGKANAKGSGRSSGGSSSTTGGGASTVNVDDSEILAGLNDMLASAAAGREDAAGSAAEAAAGPGPGTNHSPLAGGGNGVARLGPAGQPVSILRPSSTGPMPAPSCGAAKAKRVRWPDQSDSSSEEDGTAGGADTASMSSGPPSRKSSGQLAEVLYLEGLGPPPELESLPYGYQRRQTPGAASPAAAGPSGGAELHAMFREQVKAEHVAEHDLFRQLLVSKQQAGLFAVAEGDAEVDEP